MKSLARYLVVAVALAAALFTMPLAAQQKPAIDPALDAAIRDFIMRNPQVIREALAKAELDEQIDRTKTVLREQRQAIYGSGSPSLGGADAKVTIVEFFDYNCPYCRKSHAELTKFLAANGDVRVVLKDIGNLGQDSEAIAKLVIAVRKQNQHAAFHAALMGRQGRTTEAAALDLARTMKLDVDRLKKDAASAKTARELAATRELADKLSVQGTPLYIIGHNGIAGAPDDLTEQFARMVGEVRSKGCDVC